MGIEKESSISDYRDLTVEVYHSDEVSPELRSLLENEVDDYVEKYMSDSLASKPVPVMAIQKEGEIRTLLGDEINRDNVEEFLD